MKSILRKIYHDLYPHRVKGDGNVLNECQGVQIYIVGNNNVITLGTKAIVRCSISIIGDNNIVEIRDGAAFYEGKIQIEGNKCLYVQGEKSGIRGAQIIIQEDYSTVSLGKNCMLGYHITMRTSDAHSILDCNNNRINPPQSITIGDHVWISESVTVLKGVTIGDNSVIGYGAICTKDIPSHSIAVGLPASVVKENINWSSKRL